MLNHLESFSSLRAFSVNLEWDWTGPGARPNLVLLRRTRAHPQYSTGLIRQEELIDDGLVVVDVEQDFAVSDRWIKIHRELYLGRNDRVETNLYLAEFSQFYADVTAPADEPSLPSRIVISYYDSGLAGMQSTELTDITLVNYREFDSPDWAIIHEWEIFHAPGGGPTVRAGLVTAFEQHRDGITANRFSWQPEASLEQLVSYETSSKQLTEVNLSEDIDVDSGDWLRKFQLVDQALEGGEIYYYRLYLKHGSNFVMTEFHWSTQSIAGGDYEFSDQLYQRLPAVHQYYDEPDASLRGRGQLRRYLSLAGASLDHSRSQVEALRDRHNVNRVYSKALPGLARMIGWQPDVTTDTTLLRKDIADAPDIYRSVGTVTNLRSVVNRVTGWDCKIKEFVHNIFLTNSVEKIRLWEIWSQYHDGVSWSSPESQTTTDEMDGHPVLLTDSIATAWLFWHSNRAGARSLWGRQFDLPDAQPRQLVLRIAEERDTSEDIDEYPCAIADGDRLWLFWASNRNDSWNIWGSWSRTEIPFSAGPDSSEVNQANPVDLSNHDGSDDRNPACLLEVGGSLRLFWQSNRRGPTDIWSRSFNGSVWGLPERITTASFRHLSPAVATDADGRVWLFYCDDLGDRINIHVILNIAGSWTESFQITDGLHRDESPTAVLWNGEMQLFWQSNRNQRWQLLRQSCIWNGLAPDLTAGVETVTDEVTPDKEPFIMVDSATNHLHLLWRSQRRGPEYHSRSIDTGNPKMIAELRTFHDRAHYTYDTEASDKDFYARDTVGVFLEPNPEHPDLDDRNRRLFNGPLKEFVPINIRPVLFILPEVHREYVYTYDFPEVEPQRLIGEDYSRVSTRVTDEIYTGLEDSYSDTIDDWAWIRTWSATTTGYLTVDTTTPAPIDIHFRTWHTGVSEGV